MEFPENVLSIVRKAAAAYKTDVEKATEAALKRIRKLANYEQLVDVLVKAAVQDLVYDARHVVNRQLRKDAGEYGKKAKVVSGSSKAVQSASRNAYCYRIAGTVLGEVFGRDLPTIASSENGIASGHIFNARLASKLIGLVPKTKKVSEAISAKKLGVIFCEVEKSLGGAA